MEKVSGSDFISQYFTVLLLRAGAEMRGVLRGASPDRAR
jgi:hypothetical protein